MKCSLCGEAADSLRSFPTNEEERNSWINALDIRQYPEILNQMFAQARPRLCDRHFPQGLYRRSATYRTYERGLLDTHGTNLQTELQPVMVMYVEDAPTEYPSAISNIDDCEESDLLFVPEDANESDEE
ncbi:hypothetical protein QR680_011942 [Steinernema hermaphroditum]|uniref:THAP-type domain-containing protein n=1 Tax=Steinernema hermaphroditum TaxID=289476 RepID=A0AA39I2Z0_9BILA|nr:hypothetical protein QR680_011942 [Steinernema hermaphroditum]